MCADRVVRRGGGEEVSGNKLGALMYELVEGVLAVCTSSAPDDRLDGSLVDVDCLDRQKDGPQFGN
jgi:hypothetical protein